MSVDLSKLKDQKRLLLTVPLRPVQGNRFQPTGFPDLGAATFNAPMLEGDAAACLLVESPQSMANRMELTIWDPGQNKLKDFADGLSYVRVVTEKGDHLTSSIEEAHRLNSVYIQHADDKHFQKQLTEEMDYSEKNPINRKKFVETVFKYDVNSLLHGIFLEKIGGRLRLARALSSFIEAEQAEVVASGGAKHDHVHPKKDEKAGRTPDVGYANVVYPREEYAAKKINVYFSLDISQIRGYGLAPDLEKLLILLGLYKIRALLDDDLRLRTACDLAIATDSITAERPRSFELPGRSDLEGDLKDTISKCKSKFGGEDGVTKVTYKFK